MKGGLSCSEEAGVWVEELILIDGRLLGCGGKTFLAMQNTNG